MEEVLRCFAIAKGWNRWILYNDFQLKLVVVHPDDFEFMGFPQDWLGIPVKPLG